MPPAEQKLAARTLLFLALAAIVLHAVWAVQTPVAANSDRYDYLGRVENLRAGRGLRPVLDYPLRFAFGGAERVPGEDIVRPPMWPLLLLAPSWLGAGQFAGVLVAAFCAALTAALAYRLATRRFGDIAGGVAALAFALSFATRRAIWGGGPELMLACLLLLLWAWRPVVTGSAAHLAAASAYGALPLLHPAGWLLAILAAVARPGRYATRLLPWMVLIAAAIAAPWYLRNAIDHGVGGGSLQAQAELAKSLQDPGGLGPYRSASPAPTLAVIRSSAAELGRTLLARWKERILRLDAWLAWPLVALVLVGIGSDPSLARRDLLLGVAAATLLLCFSPEPRLLLPLLPIAAIWSGAGAAALTRRGVRWWVWPFVAWLAWLLPLGAAKRPGVELEQAKAAELDPSSSFVAAVASAAGSSPYLTDSSVLAWRVGGSAVFVPDTPNTLAWLRQRPALAGLSLLACSDRSPWLKTERAAWSPWFAAAETLHAGPEGSLLLRLPSRLCSVAPVGPGHELSADYVPTDLVQVPVPAATREGIELRAECWAKLAQLLEAAAQDGLRLRVLSGYRSYAYQTQLYASARERHGESQAWVAAPGQSEHQLGDAVDLADAELVHALQPSFAETPEGRWLNAHASRFDFRISFTAQNEQLTGIRAEPWHIRYVGGDRCQPQS